MQTFLPYESFEETAKVLDNKRLGKQRVETLQIATILAGKSQSKAWSNHPAVNQWRGYLGHLILYGLIMCEEWIKRGYKDTCTKKIGDLYIVGQDTKPFWLGNDEYHASHRSNLLKKDFKFYSKYNWQEPNDLPYVWPL